MELLHPFRARRERLQEERIRDVASHISSEVIAYLADQAVGDLPVFVGKPPAGLLPAEFVSRVDAAASAAIQEKAPHFAGQLTVDVERSRLASTENVRTGNHGWRNDVKPDGLTIVLTPVSVEQLATA